MLSSNFKNLRLQILIGELTANFVIYQSNTVLFSNFKLFQIGWAECKFHDQQIKWRELETWENLFITSGQMIISHRLLLLLHFTDYYYYCIQKLYISFVNVWAITKNQPISCWCHHCWNLRFKVCLAIIGGGRFISSWRQNTVYVDLLAEVLFWLYWR